MYLIDTNIISELRKKSKSNPGILQFFQQAADRETYLFIRLSSKWKLITHPIEIDSKPS